MRLIRCLSIRFNALFKKRQLEAEMDEEMRLHLEMLTEHNLKAGMSHEDAHYAAQRRFGGVEQIKERARDERTWMWMEDIWRDLRFSFRSLRRASGFSAAVVTTLALCIGANTAITSVLYSLVLKPLPYHDANQVVEIYNSQSKSTQVKHRMSLAQYLDYKAQANLFSSVALLNGWMFNTGDNSEADRLLGIRVTHDYFEVLGVQPLLGRFFTAEECEPGKDDVVVLTQTFWETNYRGDPSVVGREVRLSRRTFTIIGVAPRSLEAISVAPVLMKPFEWSAESATPPWRLAPMSFMYARIKPGVAHGAALAQLQTLEDRFRDSVAEPALRGHLITSGNKVSLDRVRAEQMKSIKSGLLLLQGGALMVLLLGCVNVSSLMLARSNARQMELALRQALGAGRGALARQLLSEAILLALAGGTLGLALTWTSLRLINTYTGMIVFGSPPIALEGYTLGLTLLGSLLVALLIGLLPVLRVWRATGMQAAIQSGTRGASRGSGIRAISSGLVIAQVALALILLCGAGLLVRSFAKVMAIDPGFDARKIIHARVAVDSSYKNSASVQATQSRILEKMREIPGVESVAYSAHNPVQRDSQPITLPLRGMGHGKDSTYPTAILLGVSPEFLPTLGIRLLEGRNFTEADLMPKARLVLVVDQRFAERYFPDQSAIGQLFAFGPDSQNPDSAPMIVGVAEAAKLRGLDDSTGVPYVYRPAALGMGGISLALRTTRTLGDMLPLIRAGVRDVDSALPVYEAATLQMHLDELGANRRGVMWLLGAFAGIALILVAVGIYGMLAYDVTQRIREIGIRGAIGATRGQIVTMILRQGLWKAGAGLIIGLIVTSFLSRYMGSLLFEVRPNDPAIFAGVAGLLLGVAFLASWLPARRAAKVDPIVALRYE